ncbi:MAG TPA: hypothetical protein VF921_07385 [Vicinamibacterales bacterium]
MFRQSLGATVHMPADGHAIASVSIAVNRAFCGRPSSLSTGDSIGALLYQHHTLTEQPLRTIIADRWGSVDRYCATVTTPFVNNENSLMLAESWMLRVRPGLSLAGVGRALLGLKIAMLLLFVLAVLRGGGSVVVGLGILQIAAAILEQLLPVFTYSLYPFLFCLVALTIAWYGLLFGANSQAGATLVTAGIGGVLSAFGTNVRTSYLPLFAALFVVYLLASHRRGALPADGTRRLRLAGALVCFVLGYAAFQYVFITRSRPNVNAGASYHPIAHPLVLSLGAPANALSRREGITWVDGVGLDLAHRVDPQAQYLSPEYESALFRYYRSLWSRYPAEMRQIYLEKFKLAGKSMIEIAKFERAWMAGVLWLLSYVRNGLWLLALFAGCAAAFAWRLARSAHCLDLVACLAAVTGCLLMVESAIIMPFYVLTYDNALLFVCGVSTLLVLQLALDGAVRLTGRVTGFRLTSAPSAHVA